METNKEFDVVIIGGSYAGLSGAMALGRALCTVLIIDSGAPCNKQTPHSHNFLTRDGETPAAIAAKGLEQVLAYPTVQHMTDRVETVTGTSNNFIVTTAAGVVARARRLLFATGVKDNMPAIPGFAACWGISVVHCPYCHGYEYRGEATGVLMNGDAGAEHAMFIDNWAGSLTLFTNGAATFSAEKRAALTARGIDVVETEIERLEHTDGRLTHVVLAGGRQVVLRALYAKPPFTQHCPIPEALGCRLTEHGFIEVDDFRKTNVAGVYVAGDATTQMRSVANAVAAGMLAGVGISRELIVVDPVGAAAVR